MNLYYMFYLSYKSILNVVIRFAIHTILCIKIYKIIRKTLILSFDSY